MSRKKESRLARNQKRRTRRKMKRRLKRIERAESRGYSNSTVVGAGAQKQIGSPTDEKPSTSRCKTKGSPQKSPRMHFVGKVDRFKKIVDDQGRRVLRRSVHLKENKQCTIAILAPKKCSPRRKNCIRKFNRSRDLQKFRKKVAKNVSSSLEEGELRSFIDKACVSSSEDEDDCIVVEPILEKITIDDNDNEDFTIGTEVATNYQSLMDSFKERVSSTPCSKRHSPINVNTDRPSHDIVEPEGDGILPFFVDIGRGTESINSTDNFTDYTKLTTLREKSVCLKETSEVQVIELDDTSNDNLEVTLKCSSDQKDDDSIIFISETNKNDFIPIVDKNLPSHKILKECGRGPSTPVNRIVKNTLFTKSETKKLNVYNQNAYNPGSSNELKTGKRMVIIDGSNVAFKHGLDQEFSVKGLTIAIEYFEKMGHEVKAVLPQFRMNKSKSSNPEELMKLNKAGKIVQTPCKNLPGHSSISYDDRFILQLAFETDAAIVSNDNYRDLLHENPAFKKIIENRVIGYTWCNDIFILPKDPYGKWGPSLEVILNRT